MGIAAIFKGRRLRGVLLLLASGALLASGTAEAQLGPLPDADAILLTIVLKHDQTRTLADLQAQLKRNGFYQKFPPEGVEVVSWYVVMGLGQVVTLRVPPAKLRAVNLAIEHSAWGAFRTDFYPAYDYKPIWEDLRRQLPPPKR
jgi:hypothetical protein